MFTFLKILFTGSLIAIVISLLPDAYELPGGADGVVQQISDIAYYLRVVIPPFGIAWEWFMRVFYVELIYWGWKFTKWIISHF